MEIIFRQQEENNYSQLVQYFTETLRKKYKNFKFINAIRVWIAPTHNKKSRVSLFLITRRGKKLFSSSINKTESCAFKKALDKMNSKIDKEKLNNSKEYINIKI